MLPLHRVITALALAVSSLGATAQSSHFGNFIGLPSSVAAGALPESAPLQLAAGQFNSGAWDMIDCNRTGADGGRYLFTGFDTSQAGIQRYDRLNGTMTTLWNASATGAALNFDAARCTPFGLHITAEESSGAQPQSCGRLFELVNPVTATAGSGSVVHANAVARVSHEGLAFDRYNKLHYIDELNGVTSVDGRATTTTVAFKGTGYQRPEDLEIQTRADVHLEPAQAETP